jgi:hypothetical protein
MIQASNRSLVEKSFAHHAARIIGRLRRLDPSCLQSSDSRLGNVWEEYKVQVQLEHSLFFSFYSDAIRRVVEEAVDSMHPRTVAVLWRLTPEAEEWGAEDSGVHATLLAEAVVDELLRRIQRIAANESLPLGVV